MRQDGQTAKRRIVCAPIETTENIGYKEGVRSIDPAKIGQKKDDPQQDNQEAE